MFCVKCGKDIGDADYCTYCGEKAVKEIETEIAPQTEKSEKAEKIFTAPFFT